MGDMIILPQLKTLSTAALDAGVTTARIAFR